MLVKLAVATYVVERILQLSAFATPMPWFRIEVLTWYYTFIMPKWQKSNTHYTGKRKKNTMYAIN